MPNHVTNRLILHSEDGSVQRFFETCIKQGVDNDEVYSFFDFNALVPAPLEIRDTESSSHADIGLLILTLEGIIASGSMFLQSQNDSIALLFLKLNAPWLFKERDFPTFKDAANWLKTDYPVAVDVGRVSWLALAKYGHKDWYSWNIANWGTKWNSYSLQIIRQAENEGELVFKTAWSVPHPVISKIREKFPDLKIHLRSWDEGWCFAYAGQNLVGPWTDNEWKPKAENGADLTFYELVYGHPYERDPDDEASV